MESERSKKCILQYVICTYGLFVLLLLILGGIATILLHGTPLVIRWLTAITAWTPTYVFLLMFKKLYPNGTVKDFYKKAFREKLNIRLLITTTVMQIIIFTASVYIVSVQRGVPAINLLDFSLPTVASALLFTLIQGATGEETGWRGYLLPAVEGKSGVVKGSLIVSLIWAFWHAPIWFLGTDYSGTALLLYIIVFVICITSLGFIIGICYHQCKNLFVPIWIHFVFNFLGEMFIGSKLDLVAWYAVFYFIMALGFFLQEKLSTMETCVQLESGECGKAVKNRKINLKGEISMGKILKILFAVIALFVLVFAGGMLYLNKGLETGRNIAINGLDMSNINDGVYHGIYEAGRWSNKVIVTVNDNKITKIEIAKDVTFAKSDVRDALFSKVIEAQNTDVDVVSGATVTCKAYLKSIENAFNK